MSKKILSVLLALVFVMSTFAVSAFAATPNFEDDASEYTQTWGLNTPVENADGTYTVEVTLKANYVAGAISFKIDGEGAKLVDAVEGAAITYVADVEFNESGLVTIIPDASAADSVGADLSAGGVVATLTYELTGASATLDLANNPKTATNPDGTLIAVRLSNGNYVNGDMICGQPVVDKDGNEVSDSVIASVSLGAVKAELVLTAKGEAAGVVIDRNKTFGGAYAGVVYGFPQTATGKFIQKAYITDAVAASHGELIVTNTAGGTGANGKYGTGSTIKVVESGETYVVVIFGDVTGDGQINVSDTDAIKGYIAKPTTCPNNSLIRFAANCDVSVPDKAAAMHVLNVKDTDTVKGHIAGKLMTFADLAEIHNSHNTYYK